MSKKLVIFIAGVAAVVLLAAACGEEATSHRRTDRNAADMLRL